MHLTQLWPLGTGTAQGEQVQLLVQHPCALLQESVLMAEPQLEGTAPTAHNSLHALPKVLQTHAFTFSHHRGWTDTHHVTQGCCAWLYEECTSLHRQEKTPPWSSDTAAPVQPCFYSLCPTFTVQSRCFPGVTKMPIWAKHTHASIYKMCDHCF